MFKKKKLKFDASLANLINCISDLELIFNIYNSVNFFINFTVKYMYAKHAACKFGLYFLKQIFQKKLQSIYNRWRTSSRSKRKCLSHSRPQKTHSVQLNKSNRSIDWNKYQENNVKRDFSVKKDQNLENNSDFGARLHRNAKEIEKRKEEVRKSLEPEYSFTPKLSSGTEKWLISRSRKELKLKNDEIAVVSGNSILQYTNFTPNVKLFMENRVLVESNSGIMKKNETFRVHKRKIWPSIISDNQKENE